MNCPCCAYPLILASSSPRRKQLLAEAGVLFEVIPPGVEEPEDTPSDLLPCQQAEALAYFKARAVADRHLDAAVLAADTLVAVDGRILGKPANRRQAEHMLRELSGTRHEVITGVALLWPGNDRRILSVSTFVTMKRMTDAEIQAYLDSGEWQGKAGAYAIQETADRYIEKVEGSFTNVVGLPMERVLELLEQVGLAPTQTKGPRG
jgi:septum formation protein